MRRVRRVTKVIQSRRVYKEQRHTKGKKGRRTESVEGEREGRRER